MKKIIYIVALAAIALPVEAKTISLEEAVAIGIANSPIRAEVEKDRLEAIGGELDSTNLENPELEFSHNLKNSNSDIMLSQPIRWSDLTLKRYSYKNSLKKLNSYEKKLDLLKIYHRVAASYYQLYVLQQERDFVQSQISFIIKAKKNIHASINSNNMLPAEILAFDTDSQALELQERQIKKQVQKLELEFLQSLNMPKTKLSLKKPELLQKLPSFLMVWESVGNKPSYQKILEMRYKNAQNRLHILETDRYMPVIAPQFGYSKEEDDNGAVAGLSISIPLWNTSRGEYKALKADKRFYQSQIAALNQVSFEELVKSSYNILQEQLQILQGYQKRVLPNYAKSLRQMEESFLNGQASVLDIMQVREKYMSAQIQYLQSMQNSLNAQMDLETLIGAKLGDLK